METEENESVSFPLLGMRCAMGGVLMGLANLVPGISGGTMLLASGVYPRFIKAIAELSTLKFKKVSIFTLSVVVVCALVAILLFAGSVKELVVQHRWIMYSLFIGLTLGGVPVVWKMAKPGTPPLWIGAIVGFAGMWALAVMQESGATSAGTNTGMLMMFIAGIAGASAMILPGVSGGYLLLVLGVYVPILSAIDAFKEALKAKDISAAMDPATSVVIPVGIGVVIGVLVVSNLLKYLLAKHEKPTLGLLLGLLVGAVRGLWPFQQGVAPKIGDMFKGRPMTAEILAELSPDKYPTERFDPTGTQIASAIGLIVLGYLITALVSKLGAGKEAAKASAT